MTAPDDFEEQAGGWLAVFSNENGNAALSRVVFASREQGKQWAKALFERHGYTQIKVYKDRVAVLNAFGDDSLTYRMLPVIQADESMPGASVSFDHIETIF